MRFEDVAAVTEAFDGASIPYWLLGGWGVDALAGHQTREHRDLDLAVDAGSMPTALRLLSGLGYEAETDWLPVRLELAAAGNRWVDLHPVVFDERGDGRQAGLDGQHFDYPASELVHGVIEGHRLPCVSRRWQLVVHTGYPPRAQDEADLAVLRALPEPEGDHPAT